MLIDALHRENKPTESTEKPLALVIEDSPQAGELLRLHIESAGYRVEIARDVFDRVARHAGNDSSDGFVLNVSVCGRVTETGPPGWQELANNAFWV